MGCTSSGYGDEQYHILMNTPFAYHIDGDELRRFAEFFVVRTYAAGQLITSVNSDQAFFILSEGNVDVVYEKTVLTTRGPHAFFGQLAADQASAIERKIEERRVHGEDDVEDMQAEPHRVGSATKRESDIEIARRADVVASTACTCIVLSARAYKEYIRETDTDTRDKIHITMGAFITKSLHQLNFFKSLSTKKVEILSSLLHYVSLKQGEVLFAEGSVGTSMYIVYQGRLKAVAWEKDEDGKEKVPPCEVILNTFKEGDFFGEISLIMGMPRTASIVALESTLLLELRKDDFANFLRLTPNLPFHDLMKRRFANHFKKYKVPFFSAIGDERYPLLASLCKVEEIDKGTQLFREGDVGNTFYIIAHGEVVATSRRKVKDVESDVELSRMGPGKYFGEIALIRDTRRTATVTATQRCVILSITKSNFEKFFVEAPEALADFEVKLARYDVAMRSVIYHPLGLEYFTKYLEKEYSAENIRFWKAARDFRHIGRDAASSHANLPASMSSPDVVEMQNDYEIDNKREQMERQQSMLITSSKADIPLTPALKEQLLQAAQHIVNNFIAANAVEQVNISGDLREGILSQVKTAQVDHKTFLPAEKEILTLLERDSFPRFKQSDLFRQFLEDADTYDEKEEVHKELKHMPSESKFRSGSITGADVAAARAKADRARKGTATPASPKNPVSPKRANSGIGTPDVTLNA